MYGFPESFVNMIQCLYVKSNVQVNVNGFLTDSFKVMRGVKQGCPLSAALYVLAMSPLLSNIQKDMRIQGVRLDKQRLLISAYADDITIFASSKRDVDLIFGHFVMYERASGAVLNKSKTECVWIGRQEKKFDVDILETTDLKILGIYVDNEGCVEYNWKKT